MFSETEEVLQAHLWCGHFKPHPLLYQVCAEFMVDRTKPLFYRVHPQHFHSWLMRMPWVQRSDSSLGVLLLHPHTLVMRSAEEESCHQSVTGPSEQGRSTGGSSSWPTFSLSQHLKVSSRFTTKGPDEDGEQPGQGETPTWRGWVFAFQHEQFSYTNSMKNRNSGFIK